MESLHPSDEPHDAPEHKHFVGGCNGCFWVCNDDEFKEHLRGIRMVLLLALPVLVIMLAVQFLPF